MSLKPEGLRQGTSWHIFQTMVTKNQCKHRYSTSHLISQKENTSLGTTDLQQGLSEAGQHCTEGKCSLLENSQSVPGEHKEKAQDPTCSGPRQHTVREAVHSLPSAQSETARGSRICAAAEARQKRNGSLIIKAKGEMISPNLLANPCPERLSAPTEEELYLNLE